MPDPKRKPAARLVEAPRYEPDLESWGLRRTDEGDIVASERCPDRHPGEILTDPLSFVDARLWEGQFGRGKGGPIRLQERHVTDVLDRAGVAAKHEQVRSALTKAGVKLRETEYFNGVAGWTYGGQSALDANYIPLIPGPATRQQYWADYWASSAKSFEASTHSGIAKRAIRAMVNYPVGRGVAWKIKDEQARKVWEAFWKANKMGRRFKSIANDLSTFGEQFIRYFPAATNDPRLVIVRQIDPATIYEIVTDQEDVETVYFYHQQYQTRMELFSPPTGNKAPQGPTPEGVTLYKIRQIDAGDIDHYKVNTVSGEARGRSDIFPALGDLKRLRDLTTAKVVGADIATRVLAVVTANGTPADIQRVIGTIFPNMQPPAPGSIVGLNEETKLEPFEYAGISGVREDFTYEELIDGIVAATGVSRADLGLSPAAGSGTTQASTLTHQNSSTKAYEDRRELLGDVLDEMWDRVMRAAGINTEIDREFIFGDLAREDRSALMDDLEQAEANGWISKRTAATRAGAELEIDDYDFDDQQTQIIGEFADADETEGAGDDEKPARGGKIRRPMIRATSRQAPKLDPTKAQSGDDEPPGLLVGGPAGAAAPPALPAADGSTPDQRTTGGLPAGKQPTARSNGLRESDPRRTPDDPAYALAADEFAQQTKSILEDVLGELATA